MKLIKKYYFFYWVEAKGSRYIRIRLLGSIPFFKKNNKKKILNFAAIRQAKWRGVIKSSKNYYEKLLAI